MVRILRFKLIALLIISGPTAMTGAVRAGSTEGQSIPVANLAAIEKAFVRLAERVAPVAVSIEVRVRQDVSAPEDVVVEAVTHGSGFVIQSDGCILTNHHVIEYADDIRVVVHDGRSYQAEVVQFDHRSDLAVLRIPVSDLPVAKLGDAGEVKAGQWAFSLGNPFGVAGRDGHPAFSAGVVGGLGRFLKPSDPAEQGERFYGDLIQTDASLNPGSSGGPLFNIEGEVIGIGTVIVSLSGAHEGLGFAIPIDDRTRRIINLLTRGEPVRYGQLGVEVEACGPPQDEEPVGGVRIVAVRGGGAKNPAARAGLRSGDVLIEVNGRTLKSVDDFRIRLDSLLVGDEVAIRYMRSGKIHETRASLVSAMDMDDDLDHLSRGKASLRLLTWNGLRLVEPTEDLAKEYGISGARIGLYILGTTGQGLFGDICGVARDFVVRCNGEPVQTVEQLAVLGQNAKDGIQLELLSGRVLKTSHH